MASRRSPQPLGKILKSVIDDMGIKPGIDKAKVVETWASLAGPQVNARTRSVWMKKKTLYVQLNSSAWRQELQAQKSSWLESLNEKLGEPMVQDIVFR